MKTKFKSKLLGVLLVLVMVLALVPFASLTAFAASGSGTENDPYVVTTYAELKDLMANAPTDGTTRYIKLGGDIISSDSNNDYALTLTNAEQNVVLDLAGYTISRNPSVTVDETIVRAKEGTLTINDSVGTGGVSSTNNYINSAIGLLADGLYNDNGTIIINGGSYTVNITSKTSYAIYQARGNLVINGGKFTGDYGLDSVGGKLTVYAGEFHSTENVAILLASITNGNLYNLTAYGDVKAQSGYNLWNFIHDDGEVFVGGVKQAKTETTQFSGNKIEIKTDMLDEIWITATTPVVGNTIPNSIDIPYTSDYEIVEEYGNQVIAWMVNGQPVNADTFAATTAYTIRAYVKVNVPTAFNFGAKVNGQPANLEFVTEAMEGYKYYWVEYTFPATIDNVIPSANVTVTAPVAGETSTAGVIFDSEKYNVSIGWSTTADESAANDFNNQTFVAGNTYYVDVYLVAKDPYVFVEGATVFVNGKSYTSVWTNGADYKEYVAVYDIPFAVPSAETYTVSFNANGGTGTIADETEQLGGYVLPDCTFTAPSGKQFKCWAEGSTLGTQYDVGDEYDVTGNVTFYAVWEDISATKYDVVYGIGEGQGSGSSESVDEGTEITLASYETIGMVAPNGQIFDYWSIRIGTAQSAETVQKQAGDKITINADTYIIAIWKDAPIPNYTITATAGANGTISPSGDTTVAQGANQTYTITANSGYHIKDVKVNGSSVGAVATYTFTNVTANATITVEFEVDTVSHVCNPTLVPEDEPDCTTAGKSAYYHCGCGKNYEDAQGNTEIDNIETWGILNALGHNPSTAWSTDGEYHWKECTRCAGQQLEKAAHTDSNNDGKCDTCEYQMSTTPNNPDNPNNTPDNPTDDEGGLGTGAIIGIVIGSVAVVGIGGFALFWFVIKKKSFADLIAVFKKK